MPHPPLIDHMHHTIRIHAALKLTDLVDVCDVRRDIDQMVAHDGPEFGMRAPEYDKAAERLQSGSPSARK